MKQASGFFPTLREAPKDAEARSHILMSRAGLVRQLAAGLYIYLPMGWQALRKIEAIVRQEMNRAGGIEVLMPTLQPDSLWKESGRWEAMGAELMRIHDRNDREFVLGPTHEEVVTSLVAGEIRSYRDLPKNIYQIQTKFRDEIRPRFGVVRSREFIMKDAYSFDRDEEGAKLSYQAMYDAYYRIFKRCGLNVMPVEADTGVMGGSLSHEFMVPSEIGESDVVTSSTGNYFANRELAACLPPEEKASSDGVGEKELVSTPGKKTIEDVAAFLKVDPATMIKTLVFVANEKPLVVLIRGDHSVNEHKVAKAVGSPVTMAEPDVVKKVTNAPVGFAGPVGISGVPIYADASIQTIAGAVTGANQDDHHYSNVVCGRDYTVDHWGDFRLVEKGETSPVGDGGVLDYQPGIEVGHVFVLGTKYSKALNAVYNDANGKQQHMVMGCYGIGVSRTLAAVIESCNDDNGIIWPASVAPFHVHLLNLSPKKENVNAAADDLYEKLQARGFDVLMDDRDERPGVKFKDSDLLGLPYRVVVGEKSLNEGKVEYVVRKNTGEKQMLTPDECLARIEAQYAEDIQAIEATL